MKTRGCGSRYNRVNMRVTDEFLDMIEFLKQNNRDLRSKSITDVIAFVLKEYTRKPENHMSLMQLCDYHNRGEGDPTLDFKAWQKQRGN